MAESFLTRTLEDLDAVRRGMRELDDEMDRLAEKRRETTINVHFAPISRPGGGGITDGAPGGASGNVLISEGGGAPSGNVVLYDGAGNPVGTIATEGSGVGGPGAEAARRAGAFAGFQRRIATRNLVPGGGAGAAGGSEGGVAGPEDIQAQTDAIVGALGLLIRLLQEAGPEALAGSLKRRVEER